jgi:microsomal dipeptidase-like Zn-dependent dipeptidase
MNNDLCGHAKSLPPLLARFINQTDGLGKGFTDMGKVVLKELLKKDKGRIYIDIKHMSAKSREEYYKILDDDYQNDPIPVLASHGAVNGRKSIGSRGEDIFNNEDKLKFNNEDVNFFNDEIIRMEKTGGFLGIQLDERRLCCPEQKKRERKKKRNRGEQLYYQAGLVWKQIRYIAEVLDKEEKFGWGTATIGSDYDGAVDPPNGYWTSDDFGILEENLIHHADKYLSSSPPLLCKNNYEIEPQEVIDLFMRGNAQRFLKDFLCGDARIAKNQEKDTLCEEAGMNK